MQDETRPLSQERRENTLFLTTALIGLIDGVLDELSASRNVLSGWFDETSWLAVIRPEVGYQE